LICSWKPLTPPSLVRSPVSAVQCDPFDVTVSTATCLGESDVLQQVGWRGRSELDITLRLSPRSHATPATITFRITKDRSLRRNGLPIRYPSLHNSNPKWRQDLHSPRGARSAIRPHKNRHLEEHAEGRLVPGYQSQWQDSGSH
jgi:hypothetical protein